MQNFTESSFVSTSSINKSCFSVLLSANLFLRFFVRSQVFQNQTLLCQSGNPLTYPSWVQDFQTIVLEFDRFPVINRTDGHVQRYRNGRNNNQHVLNLHHLQQ